MADHHTIILETERLLLRRPVMDDLDAFYALYSDKEIRQYFPDGTDGTLTYDETKEEVEWFLNGHPRHPELGLWSTILKENGEFIGRCGLLPWTLDGQDEVEVAYLIDKRYWRRGLGGGDRHRQGPTQGQALEEAVQLELAGTGAGGASQAHEGHRNDRQAEHRFPAEPFGQVAEGQCAEELPDVGGRQQPAQRGTRAD